MITYEIDLLLFVLICFDLFYFWELKSTKAGIRALKKIAVL